MQEAVVIIGSRQGPQATLTLNPEKHSQVITGSNWDAACIALGGNE